MLTISTATDDHAWDAFLASQRYRPFLQSWTMGDVYADVGQKLVRLEMRDGERIIGICFGHIVPARRGKHLAIPYGPIFNETVDSGQWTITMNLLLEELKKIALEYGCSFIRMSPFWPAATSYKLQATSYASPLHLLAEHIWYLPLENSDPWEGPPPQTPPPSAGEGLPHSTNNSTPLSPDHGGKGQGDRGLRSEEEIFMALRKTTRNLVRRAEKEGVTVEASTDPARDLELFLKLHEETRKRHSFVPYTNSFFRAQVERFHAKGACSLYVARHQGNVIATSVHMHCFGETSYHHGASTQAFGNVPASYLLQWTAIKDALKRGDRVYNFWGIAPMKTLDIGHETPEQKSKVQSPCLSGRQAKSHPFAGVTTFKTGFGGNLLHLTHCIDVPLKSSYHVTRLIENVRKWKRGF